MVPFWLQGNNNTVEFFTSASWHEHKGCCTFYWQSLGWGFELSNYCGLCHIMVAWSCSVFQDYLLILEGCSNRQQQTNVRAAQWWIGMDALLTAWPFGGLLLGDVVKYNIWKTSILRDHTHYKFWELWTLHNSNIVRVRGHWVPVGWSSNCIDKFQNHEHNNRNLLDYIEAQFKLASF